MSRGVGWGESMGRQKRGKKRSFDSDNVLAEFGVICT